MEIARVEGEEAPAPVDGREGIAEHEGNGEGPSRRSRRSRANEE